MINNLIELFFSIVLIPENIFFFSINNWGKKEEENHLRFLEFSNIEMLEIMDKVTITDKH